MQPGQKIYVQDNDVNFRKPSEAPDGVQKMSAGQDLLFVDGPWLRVTEG